MTFSNQIKKLVLIEDDLKTAKYKDNATTATTASGVICGYFIYEKNNISYNYIKYGNNFFKLFLVKKIFFIINWYIIK